LPHPPPHRYLTPDAGAGSLSAKEGILVLQRLATFERMGGADSLPEGTWDSLFLDMLYTLCTTDIELQVLGWVGVLGPCADGPLCVAQCVDSTTLTFSAFVCLIFSRPVQLLLTCTPCSIATFSCHWFRPYSSTSCLSHVYLLLPAPSPPHIMRAPPQGQSIKADVFRAIERRFLLGLRARNPATRAKFFRLLHRAGGHMLSIYKCIDLYTKCALEACPRALHNFMVFPLAQCGRYNRHRAHWSFDPVRWTVFH
jgi:hypothetical protein